MTPRHFECSQLRKGILNFNFECIKLLQNGFRKQRYITLNATIPDQDRIYPKTHLCRTFLLRIYSNNKAKNLISKIRKVRLGCTPWSGVTNIRNYSCNVLEDYENVVTRNRAPYASFYPYFLFRRRIKLGNVRGG